MFNNNKLNMLLSLIVAIALWAYVVSSVNPQQSQLVKNIPVQLENMQDLNDRGLAISNAGEVTVDITVEGRREALAGIGPGNFTAAADVSRCVEGDNIVKVDVDTGKNISLTSAATLTVYVSVEKLVAHEKKIRPEYVGGDTLDGELEFDIESADKVTVTGAESLVDSVIYVKAAVKDIDGKENGRLVEADLIPVNQKGVEVKNVTLSAKTAMVKVSELSTKEVTLVAGTTGNAKDGYIFNGMDVPKTVIIKGKKASLGNIESVEAVPVNISGFTKTTKVELTINLPEGISISSQSVPVLATVNISEKPAEEAVISIAKDKIKMTGLDEGLAAEITSGDVKITIKGISKVSEEDIKLSADVSDLEPGEYQVPLNVNYSGKGSIKSSPETIDIEITEE